MHLGVVQACQAISFQTHRQDDATSRQENTTLCFRFENKQLIFLYVLFFLNVKKEKADIQTDKRTYIQTERQVEREEGRGGERVVIYD